MLKAIVLLKRKTDITVDQFIDHYENRHVPLVREVLPTIGKYVRNYLDTTSVSSNRQDGDAPSPYFDVITELWFNDDTAYQGFIDALADPEVSRRLQEDEDRFLDRSIVQTYAVKECGI
ncbi:EthD family reductase (plasmid) [Sphingomonas paeninsulae]|uniref:EthD family reductase n=1 Tax=Sphingomonas paeninsulae TaxID=2319844 RepID=A0A494T6Y4_SPHPE|nr:EthD domain-containing protein [Sphingomonas paeninsulae]AYJ85159.1 EthD family reductase [Sphingomonas paeninsulae]